MFLNTNLFVHRYETSVFINEDINTGNTLAEDLHRALFLQLC